MVQESKHGPLGAMAAEPAGAPIALGARQIYFADHTFPEPTLVF
jgi:hypothetical protein